VRQPFSLVRETMQSSGEPLDPDVQQHFASYLGHDFSKVRVHYDGAASLSAAAVDARAYNLGSHIVFGSGEFSPRSIAGRTLLAHELTHVIQRGGASELPSQLTIGDSNGPPEREAEKASRLTRSAVLHPSAAASAGINPSLLLRAPTTVTARAATPQDTVDYLRELAVFMQGQADYVNELLRIAQVEPAARAQADRQRAQTILTQQLIQTDIGLAKQSFDSAYAAVPANDPLRTAMRSAFEAVLSQARLSADIALGLTDANPTAQAAGRLAFAETLARIVEASPMTSAGLAATTQFTAADATQAAAYQTELSALLDDMLAHLPGLQLTPAQQDGFYQRLQIALRRAFTTISAGPAGTIDVRGISDPAIVDKYQRVSAMLAQGVANQTHVQLITDRPPASTPPDPVPDVTSQLAPRVVDVSHVPADEVLSVRFGVLQAVNSVMDPASTVQFQNAIWPLVLQIRHGATVTPVRYELTFDATGNVRAERLGSVQPREAPTTFSQLSTPDKKAALIQEFGLAGVDDRPGAPAQRAARGRPAMPQRPEANWTDDELNQVKAAYDLLPAGQRAALHGLTIVRDHVTPVAQAGQRFQLGVFHSGADATYDTPAPPAHGPPHIHYFDEAFAQNNFTASSAAGIGGPGGDYGLIHEIGHAEGNEPIVEANLAITSSHAALVSAVSALQAATRSLRFTRAQSALRTTLVTWQNRMQAANVAIANFNAAVIATQPNATQVAQRLQAAQTALASEQTARAALDASALPAAVITAADAVSDALPADLASSQQFQTASQQNDIFISIATRFGFYRFTDYAIRGGANDWFAETYALFVTDPNRLNQMNRNMFLWFQAGMPLDANWNPPPHP
jgi:hypothetical protein